MTAGGSQQLRLYRRARRAGSTVMTACVESGISMAEARMVESGDAANPPPPEAYELLTIAPVPAPAQENDDMARPKKTPAGQINGEVPAPDYDRAIQLYREDIKPAQAKVGEHAQEQSTAYKEIKKGCHIQPQAAKAAFKLDDMEPAKRDDWLRSFNGLLKGLGIFMPRDLADIAEGKGISGENVVPIGDGAKPKLATIPLSDGKDDDLAGGDELTGDGTGEALPEIGADGDGERQAEAAE